MATYHRQPGQVHVLHSRHRSNRKLPERLAICSKLHRLAIYHDQLALPGIVFIHMRLTILDHPGRNIRQRCVYWCDGVFCFQHDDRSGYQPSYPQH